MKPVAIIRFLAIEAPGYFVDFLDTHKIPYQLIKIDEDEKLPDDISLYSGLVLMGGSMSVNDDLPWIEPMQALIRAAVTGDVPVLGHCLGGQLISKALGGAIGSSAVHEMGWGSVHVADNPVAHEWFNDVSEFRSFHWHGETFSVPDGATPLLSSPFCENQAFALGIHLAMQCHVEMTEKMVKTWCQENQDEIMQRLCSSVQSAEEILADLPERITALNKIANRLYSQWIKGLKY
jgi:GMP synthase-like glutamine amidotransferase